MRQDAAPGIAKAIEIAGSQVQLSKTLDICDRTVRRWLDGDTAPTRRRAQHILQFLKKNGCTNYTLGDFYK